MTNKSKLQKHVNHCKHMIYSIKENKFFHINTYYFKKQIEVAIRKINTITR